MNILGYNSYYQVLNAKDYGIPQNRERVYTISIRKDIDKGNFVFPLKEELKLRLKDMLESEVDQKYYLSEKQCNVLQAELENKNALLIDKSQAKREGKPREYNEIAPTLSARDYKEPRCVQVRNTEPKIMVHNIQQLVKVRVYPVDIEALKTTLRTAKLNADLNNKQIAEMLNIPQTQVEHYFRTDSSFAIPSPEIWLKLKEILKIETNYFDESIMTFEEKGGVYEKANRIYDEQGLAPTLTQQEEKILIRNANKKGYIEAEEGDGVDISSRMQYHRGNVQKGMIQTLDCQGGNSKGVVVNERN